MFVLSSPLPVLLLLLAANPAVAICPDEDGSCAGCVEDDCAIGPQSNGVCDFYQDGYYEDVTEGFEPATP